MTQAKTDQATPRGVAVEREVRCAVPKRADVDSLMKRCQIGVGGRHALDEAHSIMAECYGTLGALMLTVERYAAALEWIDGATAATPGLTEAQLGRVLATIGRRAGDELSAPNAELSGRAHDDERSRGRRCASARMTVRPGGRRG